MKYKSRVKLADIITEIKQRVEPQKSMSIFGLNPNPDLIF